MWTKIYLGLLAVAVIVAGFFAYYAWSWLGSIGDPRVAWEAFNYHKRGGVYFLVCSTAVLLVVGNVILWTGRNAWALWVSHVYYAVFILIFLIFLHLAGTSFCLEKGVCTNPSNLVGPLLAVGSTLALTAFIFADQFLLLRLHAKIHGRPEPSADEQAAPDEESSRLE